MNHSLRKIQIAQQFSDRIFENLIFVSARDFYPTIDSIYQNEWKRSTDWFSKRLRPEFKLML